MQDFPRYVTFDEVVQLKKNDNGCTCFGYLTKDYDEKKEIFLLTGDEKGNYLIVTKDETGTWNYGEYTRVRRTVKGTAGMIKVSTLEELAQESEQAQQEEMDECNNA